MKVSGKVISVVGKLLMVASLVFIVRHIMQHDVDFSVLASPFVILGLLLTAVIFGLGIAFTGLNFKWFIANITGISVNSKLVVKVYCASNLYKYLPGSVMYLIGRNRIAFEAKEVSHSQIAFATVLEGTFMLLSAIVIIAVSVSDEAVYFLRRVTIPSFVWMIAGGVALACVALAIIFRRRMRVWRENFSDSMRNFKYVSRLKRLGTCLFIILVLAFTYLATLILLGQQVTLGMVPTVIGLYLLAWIAGFLTPGAAGGMGVREVVLLMFLGYQLNPAIVLPSAIVHRLLTIVGDVVGYVVALVYSQAGKK